MMPTNFEILLAAVIADDRAEVKLMLARHASLARCAVEVERYEARLVHWIYAGDTVLHVAAAGHRWEIGEMLLAAGADPNSAQNRRLSQPLHYAADGFLENPAWDASRQVAMIRLLLEAGCDPNARDKNGATPLHRAVRTRCAAAVRYLLEAGATPTLQNKPGSTAFHLAVQTTGRGGSGSEPARIAQREIIDAFLKRGVSPTLADARGKSVLDWTRSDWIRRLLTGEDS